MSGRLIGIILLVCAAIAGGGLYYLQIYAFYARLDPGAVTLPITKGGVAETLVARDVEAIDAESSPIRFRACFTTDPDTVEGADPYDNAVPLNAPGWFDCFDASTIGADLEAGRATAVLGQRDVIWGIDRVLAIYPDGRGVAWHQINPCGAAAFDGDPLPLDCSPPPGE